MRGSRALAAQVQGSRTPPLSPVLCPSLQKFPGLRTWTPTEHTLKTQSRSAGKAASFDLGGVICCQGHPGPWTPTLITAGHGNRPCSRFVLKQALGQVFCEAGVSMKTLGLCRGGSHPILSTCLRGPISLPCCLELPVLAEKGNWWHLWAPILSSFVLSPSPWAPRHRGRCPLLLQLPTWSLLPLRLPGPEKGSGTQRRGRTLF